MLVQTNIVLAVASDPDNPITSAITSAISEIVNPSPTATPTPTVVPSSTPSATLVPQQTSIKGPTQQVKVWMLEYHPSGDYFHVNGDNKTFTQNVLLPAMNDASKYRGFSQVALNYTLANSDTHVEYNVPPQAGGRYDYQQLFTKYDLCNLAKQNDIKAVILWADGSGPYAGGFWESAITGSKSIPTNGGYLPYCNDKTIVVYGLNYTRGLDAALHSYGHHLERVFGQFFQPEYTNWSKSCGTVHIPVNASQDYDYINQKTVTSDCESWNPQGIGITKSFSCNQWNCDETQYHKWWMENIPGIGNTLVNQNGSKTANWWTLIGDPDNCIANPLNCSQSTQFSPESETTVSTPIPVATPVINSIFPNPATQGTYITLTGSNFSYASKVYLEGFLLPSNFITVSQDGKSLTFILTTELNYKANQVLTVYVQNENAKSNQFTLTVAPSIIDPMPKINSNQLLLAPAVSLDKDHPEVVMTSSNFNTFITVPSSLNNASLKFANTYVNSGKVNAFVNNKISIEADTAIGNIKVQFPDLSTISGPAGWDGKLNAPQLLSTNSVNLPAENGKTVTTHAVLEVGAGDTALTFDKAVRLLIPNQAGKLTGFQRGSTFTKIAQGCISDTQTAGDSLPAEAECFIASGSDLVIWTKHFTKFITYNETAISANSSSNSANPSSSNPAVCSDARPGSAPKLLSAVVSGRNQVTLNWSKASDPVSYYLITYGTKPGLAQYGNPNIGGKDTISYVVKGLNNGQTYYFKVRAGNNCMPGEFSNEIAVKASGDNVADPASGFKAGVLSAQNQKNISQDDLKFKPITSAKPERVLFQSGNLFAKIINFIAHLFGRS